MRRAAQISVHTSPLAVIGGKDAGGMNVYILELARHLAATGLASDIFTRRDDPATPEVVEAGPGVKVISISAGPATPLGKNDLFAYLPEFAAEMALYSLRAGVRYDLVHAHYWLSGWAAHLAQRYWQAPVLQMFHTTAHQKNKVASTAQQESPLRARIERRLLGLVDGLIAASPEERADLIWRFRVPAARICMIPPGVDLTRFTSQPRDAARAAFGLGPAQRTVTFVGRIDPIKGIDTLIEAVSLLATDASVPPPTVLFVGGELNGAGEPVGPLAAVADDVKARGLSPCFRFLGSLPQAELPHLYNAADVVAVPSAYESFGLVAVEAMACGTPVVASRTGGLAFTVEDGVAGLLVERGDATALAAALRRVLSDDAYRAHLAAGARPTAERFAWPTVAASMRHVYDRLAAGHRAYLCHNEESLVSGA